jgi:NAD(P)-dependent dehydrogenase (short-subunit alcohol dehydrogenase family)
MRLKDKSVLITGAGGAIGSATAVLFAAEGARLTLVDLEPPEAVAAALAGAGAPVAIAAADVTREADCARMVELAERSHGRLDVLFNNAGICLAEDAGPVETPLGVWEKTVAVNLTGVFLGCRAGIPALLRAGGGSIINMGSMVAFLGSATPQIAYAATKGGVVALTQEIAAIYARRGIRANALCPGPVETEMVRLFYDDAEKRERRRVHQPMGRLARPEEIARAALFLASEDSSHMTGQSLLIDGGITRAYTTPLDRESGA